ncbi:YIP1 family protein [Luteimonas sp. BDR2-5]|uniref:YIP1 family protein n=1 Tax=Proluteimonas luteida TaxID=2878685 RepID=UPI001E57C73F|nr:YIP1 family protein [Luteimonas sp. BDR2-5]MCD9027632.1 YIP1 family protein [Luteimonas sp. BDR2-5]
MSRPSSSFTSGLIDLFLAPVSLFEALPTRRFWGWGAFLLTSAITVVALYVFITPMSPEWIVEQQVQQMGARMSGQELAQVRPQLLAMAPYTAPISAIGGVFASGLLVVLLGSVYMLLERLATRGPRHGWGQWLRFTVWTQLPQVLYALGLIALALLAQAPDQPLTQLGYASLNGLVLDLPPGHRWANWASNLGLFQLWSIVLAAVGIRVWTQASWARAAALAALPWILVFGVWALFV